MINIYDFDKTIYNGDSSIDFLEYSLKKHFYLVMKSIIKTIPILSKYTLKKCEFKEVKQMLYSYIKDIENLDEFIDGFVEKNICKIKKWYKKRQKENDLIISASYELWIIPFCKKIGIRNVLGTKVNIKTGKIIGENCKGKEKIKRFNKAYKNQKVENAYSDSKSDIPMFEIATNKAYLVKGEKLILYNVNK